MRDIKLGNFGKLVLLLVEGGLYTRAYSVKIVEEYQKQTGKKSFWAWPSSADF